MTLKYRLRICAHGYAINSSYKVEQKCSWRQYMKIAFLIQVF